MLTIVVSGRNDGYGGGFLERLLRTAAANADRLRRCGVRFEYLLVEWNPVPDRPLAAEALARTVPEARAIVVGAALHDAYSLNPAMAFHEMAAKNVGIRHARGHTIVVTNADVIFGDEVVDWLASTRLDARTLYRASRRDVGPDCPPEHLSAPHQHLPSGEGPSPTCSYLGAGGDFCAARRELWLALGGFDERTRFTTRSKDWQFFLSARARRVAVKYIGTVYHLDHGEGFRNTPDALRNSDAAHFGAAWDFELDVPLEPPDAWGLADAELREDDRLHGVVHASAPRAVSRWRATCDRDAAMWSWVRASGSDVVRAGLMHAITAAAVHDRALVVEPRDARSAAAAWGLARVARAQRVDVRVRWEWPVWCRVADREDRAATGAAGPHAWTATLDDAGIDVHGAGGERIDISPRRHGFTGARFNPLLARRLLRAWLQMHRAGWRRVAIYGAGSHTGSLLSMGVPDWLTMAAIVVSGQSEAGSQQRVAIGMLHMGQGSDIPVLSIEDLDRGAVDGVLLSSVSYEADMRRRAEAAGWPTMPLYADDAEHAGAVRAQPSDSLRSMGA